MLYARNNVLLINFVFFSKVYVMAGQDHQNNTMQKEDVLSRITAGTLHTEHYVCDV